MKFFPVTGYRTLIFLIGFYLALLWSGLPALAANEGGSHPDIAAIRMEYAMIEKEIAALETFGEKLAVEGASFSTLKAMAKEIERLKNRLNSLDGRLNRLGKLTKGKEDAAPEKSDEEIPEKSSTVLTATEPEKKLPETQIVHETADTKATVKEKNQDPNELARDAGQAYEKYMEGYFKNLVPDCIGDVDAVYREKTKDIRLSPDEVRQWVSSKKTMTRRLEKEITRVLVPGMKEFPIDDCTMKMASEVARAAALNNQGNYKTIYEDMLAGMAQNGGDANFTACRISKVLLDTGQSVYNQQADIYMKAMKSFDAGAKAKIAAMNIEGNAIVSVPIKKGDPPPPELAPFQKRYNQFLRRANAVIRMYKGPVGQCRSALDKIQNAGAKGFFIQMGGDWAAANESCDKISAASKKIKEQIQSSEDLACKQYGKAVAVPVPGEKLDHDTLAQACAQYDDPAFLRQMGCDSLGTAIAKKEKKTDGDLWVIVRYGYPQRNADGSLEKTIKLEDCFVITADSPPLDQVGFHGFVKEENNIKWYKGYTWAKKLYSEEIAERYCQGLRKWDASGNLHPVHTWRGRDTYGFRSSDTKEILINPGVGL